MVALKPPNNSCYCKKKIIAKKFQKLPNMVTLVIRQKCPIWSHWLFAKKLSNLVTLVIRQKLLPICPQRRRW